MIEWLNKLKPGFYTTQWLLEEGKRMGFTGGQVLDALREWKAKRHTDPVTKKLTWIVKEDGR